ncbi:sensor histidine kinase [uncultured Jatrophihabitans sp.]|uniref:sensor histidine kinase n=1 Tax=uncultured Jatrophihabitans sp. TaxID=1610747 RepID=UPI0035CA3BD5
MIGLHRYRSQPDPLFAAAALAIMLATGITGHTWGVSSGWVVLLVLVAWSPALLRTRWPLPVLVVAAIADTVHVVVAGHAHHPASIFPAVTMLALYTVGTRYPARAAWTAATVTAIVLLTAGLLSYSHVGLNLLYLNWVLVATALGRLIQERRERIAAAEARAKAAEHSRQIEADRQVTAERVRIAHELHDVLAHHITLVNAQAGVAQYLLDTDPVAAKAALSGIAANSLAALEELRATLGLLRAEGDPLTSDPRAPLPTVAQLDRLVDGVTAAGVRLTVSVVGQARPLSGSADLGLYRIVQEALTNATRHAPGSDIRLEIRWTTDSVDVEVINTETTGHLVGSRNKGTGHGLIGIRERATAAGGSAVFGPTQQGGYRVAATLPVSIGSHSTGSNIEDQASDPGESRSDVAATS